MQSCKEVIIYVVMEGDNYDVSWEVKYNNFCKRWLKVGNNITILKKRGGL